MCNIRFTEQDHCDFDPKLNGTDWTFGVSIYRSLHSLEVVDTVSQPKNCRTSPSLYISPQGPKLSTVISAEEAYLTFSNFSHGRFC